MLDVMVDYIFYDMLELWANWEASVPKPLHEGKGPATLTPKVRIGENHIRSVSQWW